MRTVGLHVPVNHSPQPYVVQPRCLDANGRSPRPATWVGSALPATTSCQHVVDVGIGSLAAGLRLPSVGIDVKDLHARPLGSDRQSQRLAVLPSTDLSSNAGRLCGVRAETQQKVAHMLSADEQRGQISGLHVLRQYVPSAADLHDQLQQQQATSKFDAGSEPLLANDTEKVFQKSIVRSLRLCDSVQQLAEVIGQHGPHMDFISMTSCFTAAAQLITQQRQPVQVQQDSNEPQQTLRSESPGQNQQQMELHTGAQNSTPAAGQLMDADEHLAVPGSASISTQRQLNGLQLQQFNSKLAAPKYPVESTTSLLDQLIDLLQQQLVPLLQTKLQRSADATGLVLVLYSLAVLGYKRDEGLLADLEQAVTPLIPQLSPRLLSQLLWSLSTLSLQPQQLLMLRILLQSGRLMHQANAQDCAQLIQGMAKLQQQPPESWMDEYWSRVSELLHDGSLAPHALCVVMHSLGKLQRIPPAALLLDLQSESQQVLHTLPPAGIVMLANALHMLGVKQPIVSWQFSYLQAAQNVLQECTARELAVLAVPLMRWRQVPPQGWVQQYMALCQQKLPDMTPQGLAVLGHSLSALKLLPSEQWLLDYLTAAKQQQLASTPAGCSYHMCTLGAWRRLLQKQAEQATSSSQAAVQNTHNRPDQDGVLHSSHAVAAAAADLAAAAEISRSQAINSSGGSPALMGVLASQCVQCFLDHGDSFTAEQLGMFCRGVAMFGLPGSQQLCKRLQQVAVTVLQSRRQSQLLFQHQQQRQPSRKAATAATMVNILLALATSCPAAATPKLLRALWAAMQRQVHTVTPAQAAAIAWATARLAKRATRECSTKSPAWKPPGLLADSLLQRVLVEVDSASVGHLTVLLLGVRQADWVVDPSRVVAVVDELLEKQTSLLQMQQQQQHVPSSVYIDSGEAEAAADAGLQHGDLPGQQQQLRKDMAGDPNNTRPRHSNCKAFQTSSRSKSSKGGSSDSSSTGARVFGLANHRLKAHLAATGALAA